MKTIAIEGVIGWDVLASDIRKSFEEAKGEDIDLIVNSPGGSVYEGFAIYNTIRDYRKQGGKVTARVIGFAASMSSYIPLAADKVAIEDNAVWMIHNPWSLAIGDHREMVKTAKILDGLTAMIAGAYIKKTGKETAEVRQMMDDETYLFGQEIIDNGFADELVPAGDGAEDKEQALALCKLALDEMKTKMQAEPERQQLDKVAAFLKPENIKPGVSGKEKTAAEGGEKTQEVKGMTLDELKKDNSAVYAEAVQDGVKQERERRNAIMTIAALAPDNADLQTVCSEAVETGIQASDPVFMNKVVAAQIKGKKLDGENPPAVESQMNVDALSAEDKEAAKLAGMTDEEYRKFAKKEAK